MKGSERRIYWIISVGIIFLFIFSFYLNNKRISYSPDASDDCACYFSIDEFAAAVNYCMANGGIKEVRPRANCGEFCGGTCTIGLFCNDGEFVSLAELCTKK